LAPLRIDHCSHDQLEAQHGSDLEHNRFHSTFHYRVEYNKVMARLWSDVDVSTGDECAKVVRMSLDASHELSFQAIDQVREGTTISRYFPLKLA
jgi:hypothetical protein